MNNAFCKLIIWSLIAELAIIAGVGEGLHCIPGCGHGVELGNRILLLGIDLPEGGDSPVSNQPGIGQPADLKIPIYDEDLCAICSMIGKNCTPADSVQLIMVVPLVDDVPQITLAETPTAIISFFHSRAPPLV